MTTGAAAHGDWGWVIKRALVGLRWTGLAGLILLAVAGALVLAVSRPLLDRLQQLEQEARALSAKTAGPGAKTPPPTQGGQLAGFYAFFPSTPALPDMLARMQRAARDNGLTLERGEYRMVRDAAFALARYQMTLPVRGSYAQVRGFVNDVLDSVPAAALDEMTLKREDVAEPVLEARVRFTLFLGAQ